VAVRVVGTRDRALGLEVGQQREAKMPGLGIGAVAPDAVYRDAHQLGFVPLELGQELIE
jgi:hypothetical protein